MRLNDLSTSSLNLGASFTTEVTNVQFIDNIGLIFTWAGTLPIGEIFVDVSNDDVLLDSQIINWSSLDFGSANSITGSTGDAILNINQVPFTWIRVRYVRTSGTGTMFIDVTTKQSGG